MSEARRTVKSFADKAELAQAATDLFVESATRAISDRGRFAVALAGGSTPRDVYARLAQKDLASKIPWEKVHVFFGDERCVPATHKDSNFKMASEALLWHVPVPPVNQNRMRGEDPNVENAAAEYEAKLRSFFKGEPWPRFDLVLLGIGPDGHTASLFPGTKALDEKARWVVANYVPKFEANRITLTFPALNAAHRVAFLVSGADKVDALARVLAPTGSVQETPSRDVAPTDGELLFLVDRAAQGKA